MKKKSLSAKKITHKILNFKKNLKDKEILRIYENFEKNFENLNIPNKIAVAISGGPDSMALCFLVNCYKNIKHNKIRPFFYLVDHGLRKESAKEAVQVKENLEQKKIKLKILKWRGTKPTSNLQDLARQARYKLLFDECKKSNIRTLLTAHHQDDLYETFFSRLLRGSGTEGLSSFVSMKKEFNFKGELFSITRPLLNLQKKDLIYIANNVFNFYIDDPSNRMDKFQRVILRKLILNLKSNGMNLKKLMLTLNNLHSTNVAINEIVYKNIKENTFLDKKQYLLNNSFFLYPDEIVLKSFSNVLKTIGKKQFPPRGRKMVNLLKEIRKKHQLKATLGGTIIKKVHNSVIVTKEKTKKS
tara:strand:+ start:125 stop:1195 length:1071 start_codon:yes stop_codon:yes gene_type:complete